MPKGDNPNSRKNLEKGKATRFRKGDTQGKREAAIASNKSQAARKTFAEELQIALDSDTTVKGKKINVRVAIVKALVDKAKKGDYRTFESIRDTVGEKPVEKVEHIEPPVIIDDIPEK